MNTNGKNNGKNGMARTLVASLLAASTLFAAGFSTARADERRDRGSVVTQGPAVRMIVQGPVDLHAYAQTKIGQVFLANATGNGERDCLLAHGKATGVNVVADRRVEMQVPAGKVACVAVTKAGTQELLWKTRSAPAMVATR